MVANFGFPGGMKVTTGGRPAINITPEHMRIAQSFLNGARSPMNGGASSRPAARPAVRSSAPRPNGQAAPVASADAALRPMSSNATGANASIRSIFDGLPGVQVEEGGGFAAGPVAAGPAVGGNRWEGWQSPLDQSVRGSLETSVQRRTVPDGLNINNLVAFSQTPAGRQLLLSILGMARPASPSGGRRSPPPRGAPNPNAGDGSNRYPFG